jgi:hypothetical protein
MVVADLRPVEHAIATRMACGGVDDATGLAREGAGREPVGGTRAPRLDRRAVAQLAAVEHAVATRRQRDALIVGPLARCVARDIARLIAERSARRHGARRGIAGLAGVDLAVAAQAARSCRADLAEQAPGDDQRRVLAIGIDRPTVAVADVAVAIRPGLAGPARRTASGGIRSAVGIGVRDAGAAGEQGEGREENLHGSVPCRRTSPDRWEPFLRPCAGTGPSASRSGRRPGSRPRDRRRRSGCW